MNASAPSTHTVRLCHLYPNEMNIYADRGNIAVLSQRLKWRGMRLQVTPAGMGQPLGEGVPFDMFYLGGGQDRDQAIVAKDLAETKAKALKFAFAKGAVGLFVCGGYQLAGHSYESQDGETLPGIGVLDIETSAGSSRLIGDLLIQTSLVSPSIAGYENHAGRTHLGTDTEPLGKVIYGHGNNGKDQTEGAMSDRVIGTYLHGPLLPRNPELADCLIAWALENRYGQPPELPPLDDTWEKSAHASAAHRARASKRLRGRPLRRSS